MKFYIEIEKFAEYEFDLDKCTEEEAKEIAIEWFSEQEPTICILHEDEHP